MKEYVNLFYLPMYIAYAYWELRWAKLGRQFMKGQKQYKPWLEANEYVNKNAGWHHFLGEYCFSLSRYQALLRLFLMYSPIKKLF